MSEGVSFGNYRRRDDTSEKQLHEQEHGLADPDCDYCNNARAKQIAEEMMRRQSATR
jgi:hypothetical protein